MMAEPKGTVPPGHPWWGKPKFDIRYDTEGARLMAQAGYSPAKPMKVKIQISASGSGQMQPLPMNEFVQQSLKQCGFDVQFDVIEWNTLFTNWRKGAKDPSANGTNAVNISFAAMDPFFAMVRFVSTKTFAPCQQQLGLLRQPRDRQAGGRRAHQLRRQGARRRAGQAAFVHRRRRALRLDRPRRRPARHVAQGEERGAAAELVHRHRHHDDGLTADAGLLLRGVIYALPILIGVALVCFTARAHRARRSAGVHPAARRIARTAGSACASSTASTARCPEQFAMWLWRALHGDLGVSIASNRAVAGEVFTAVGNTLRLAVVATFIGFVLGCLFGFVAGYFRGSWVDRLARWSRCWA
jgi:hypothetical protein